MIKLGETDLFPYLGDYRPLNVYLGAQKLAGWKWESQSGKVLHFINTYKHLLHVGVDGLSIQDGIPTPDNPIEIQSLNDFEIVSSTGKPNLFTGTYNPSSGRLPSYSTSVVKEEGKYAVLFDNTKNIITLNQVGSLYQLKDGQDYTFSFYAKASKDLSIGYVYMNGQNTGFLRNEVITTKWKRHHFTFIAKTDSMTGIHMYPKLTTNDGISYESLYLAEWKLEEGELSDYSESPLEISTDTYSNALYKTNILLDEPLRSVGDVKDKLFRDVDGVWKVERNIGEVIVRGSNTWNVGGDNMTNVFRYYVSNIDLGIQSRGMGISSHFENVGNTADKQGFLVGAGNRYPYFHLNKIDYPNIEAVKNWFSSNPVTVLYVLVEPTIEVLPQALQTKLNSIASYKDSNYVYTIDKSDLLPTLHATSKVKDI